jgi:Spy/CpxP family protein refolding chaperone
MRRTLAYLAVACSLVGSLQAQTPAKPVSTTTAPTPSPAALDSALSSMRADMQSKRADIMAKNLELTADQAAKFWPVFNAYQKEQNVIMDAQLKSIQQYVDNYQTLDDAGALELLKAHLDRDAKMTVLRQRYLAEFQKVVPGKVAARAIQIDRRLSNLAQLEISSQIPLVH